MGLGRHLKGFPDLPPVWLLGALTAIWGLGRLPGWSPGVSGDWAGVLLIMAGLGMIGWAASWFLRKRTPIEPHHAPTALIVEGPFRVSRNPIYLGLVAIALGAALRQPSVVAVLVVPVLWWVLDRRFAAPEEAGLRKAFGPAAEPFLARTRRWL